MFEYLNALDLIEKRFFRSFECDCVFFRWHDILNGVQSIQKSIQFEKASVLFNCASIYTQMTSFDWSSHCNDDKLAYWLKAAGCLVYLSSHYSFYSPSLDMCTMFLSIYEEIFICQAYEIKCKIFLNLLNKSDNSKLIFSGYMNCSKIFSLVYLYI